MINRQLTHPDSIVVVGGSNDIHKPGGKVLKNLKDGGYMGSLYVLNPKETEVQGVPSYPDPEKLPEVDLAIMAIAAKYIPDTVRFLAEKKKTKAFIVLSAGFSEESAEGKVLEDELVSVVNENNAALIGPNCVGILTPHHHSIFTLPIPKLDPGGCDFISGSGATACFIMEAGIPNGLRFNQVYSVGNSAQMGVEEILQHMDEHFDPSRDSSIKLLYIENIDKPQLLLTHARSLIRKGCRIAAIKAGTSDAGSRAASSHTGALASSDTAVDALFRKAGIVRCHSREELIAVGSVFTYPKLTGKRIAVITHAGGPAVMLTDALSSGGLEVPPISGEAAQRLKGELFPGSSVSNPIDFLATGTAEQLGKIIDAVENEFDEIDAMIVIFGTPGLFPIFDVYELLDKKISSCKKPVFPVLPSTITAAEEVNMFLSRGHTSFPDEVRLGAALAKVYHTKKPDDEEQTFIYTYPEEELRAVLANEPSAYLSPDKCQKILQLAGIPCAREKEAHTVSEALIAADYVGFPLVMKVVGPIHKSDVGGVALNIKTQEMLSQQFERMMQIPDTRAVLFQPMLSGMELFAGIKAEEGFGHLVMAGLGGIFIEVFKDAQSCLAPVNLSEAYDMIQKLKSYPLIKGVRGQKGVNEALFAEIIIRLSELVHILPEIKELDLNPLLGNEKTVIAVDVRIRIEN